MKWLKTIFRFKHHQTSLFENIPINPRNPIKTCTTQQIPHADKTEIYEFRGFIHKIHFNGKFVILRDSNGMAQFYFNKKLCNDHKDILKLESAVSILGHIENRPKDKIRIDQFNGAYEIVAKYIKGSPCLLPDLISNNKSNENLRLTNRSLSIRTSQLHILKLRSKIYNLFLNFFNNENFTYIDTPTFSWRGFEGSNEFHVLNSIDDKKTSYHLTQSPQMYKQILMASGVEKYIQIARCYRNEKCTSRRQPEFVQLDLEMAYAKCIDVMKLIENSILHVLSTIDDFKKKDIMNLDMTKSLVFPVLSFSNCLTYYGTDKPDIRFDCKIIDLEQSLALESHQVVVTDKPCYALIFPKVGNVDNVMNLLIKRLKSQFSEKYQTIVNNLKIFTYQKNTSSKKIFQFTFNPELSIKCSNLKDEPSGVKSVFKNYMNRDFESENTEDECVVFLIDKNVPRAVVGFLRIYLANEFEKLHYVVRDYKKYAFLWVNQFPLFYLDNKYSLTNSQNKNVAKTILKFNCSHHPFTRSKEFENLNLNQYDNDQVEMEFVEKVLSVKANHYDLVLNGEEIAGGSERIHDLQTQLKMLKFLNYPTKYFVPLINALRSGCPPHAGIAIGMDRFLATLLGTKNIRDVIAFPKNSSGNDPLLNPL
ncbi:hypothetical protein A3Q56_02230 [Intoshia linei]|uniref:Aminoacyl-transfer RNA synthetases class-II family profile domain-containing protein n=1 Tax=Intoshia linei TaxID=1819745 RepID=A0A177B8N3_9BILA|nr:hypothetical protein A3Q56_02230 [Intoshia linei]